MKPEGIWPVHEIFYIESMLFNTEHATNSIHYLSRIIEKLHEGTDPARFENIDEESLLNHVQNIVHQGAALARYFWPVRKGHEGRAEVLKAALCVSDDSALKNTNLRHAVEHFDERIDKYLADGIVGYVFPRYVGRTPDKNDVPSHIFRAYYLDTGRFEVLGESFEIEGLAREILRIHELLIGCNANGGRLSVPST